MQPVVDRVGRDRGGQRAEVLRRGRGDGRELPEAPVAEAARARRQRLDERTIETDMFRTEALDTDDLALCETSGRIATLTHWSFGQLATIAAAPPQYLRSLPAAIASDAINYGLQRVSRDEHQLFAEDTAPWTVHAITSPRYARVHHDELASRVLDLMAAHPAWHLPLGYKDGDYGAERVASGAYLDRKSTRLNSSHIQKSRMPSSA